MSENQTDAGRSTFQDAILARKFDALAVSRADLMEAYRMIPLGVWKRLNMVEFMNAITNLELEMRNDTTRYSSAQCKVLMAIADSKELGTSFENELAYPAIAFMEKKIQESEDY